MIDSGDVLLSLKPGAEWITDGENYEDITWLDSNQTIPTKEEYEAEKTRLQSEYDSQEYARNRKEEYPSIEECVHAILDDQLDALQVKRQAVKGKYPKS